MGVSHNTSRLIIPAPTLLSSWIYTFKCGAMMIVVCSHEPAIVLSCPALWTSVPSRNHENSLTSSNIYSRQHREHHVHVTEDLLMVHSPTFIFSSIHKWCINSSRTEIKVLWFFSDTLIVSTTTSVGVVASSRPSNIHQYGNPLCRVVADKAIYTAFLVSNAGIL